jgi:hypothetical protein
MECYNDWNFTLAQFLLEEGEFPVSFRSGWETMDNDWQNVLNELIPYSLHNKYPAKRTMEEEPLNNILDWSQAPSEFVPYNPDPNNYQIPGDSRGWNVRAVHLRTMINPDFMKDVFKKADEGLDQVVCVWGHLPEEDFVDNIIKLDEVAHNLASEYTDVKFTYSTAIEAMRLWRQSSDITAPSLSVDKVETGDDYKFTITTNEKIFQKYPFVAIKDIDQNYTVIKCEQTGVNNWETELINKNEIAKLAVAVTDTMGNQSIESINFLPDEVYVDDESDNYTEVRGGFADYDNFAWGTQSRARLMHTEDTVIVKWNYDVEQTGNYNLFFQVPDVTNPVTEYTFKILSSSEVIDTLHFSEAMPVNQWNYLSTVPLQQNSNLEIMLEVIGENQDEKVLVVDAVKISPFVKERDLNLNSDVISLDEVSKNDTLHFNFELRNSGYKELTITNISAEKGFVKFPGLNLPLVINGMNALNIDATFYSDQTGSFTDKILIASNDPNDPVKEITVKTNVQEFFKIIDNEDTLRYTESGNWKYSVAQAYGGTSRYSAINEVGSRANFTITLPEEGIYEIAEIVPVTVNASNNALYTIAVADNVIDSIYIDQNEDSGNWVTIGEYLFPSNSPVTVSVINDGKHSAGAVLRADAVKFSITENATVVNNVAEVPDQFQLMQNYPNPFNPVTTIEYTLPGMNNPPAGRQGVQLIIYNVLGEKVATLIDEVQIAGEYWVTWDAGKYSSGVYIYRLSAGKYIKNYKMILLK